MKTVKAKGEFLPYLDPCHGRRDDAPCSFAPWRRALGRGPRLLRQIPRRTAAGGRIACLARAVLLCAAGLALAPGEPARAADAPCDADAPACEIAGGRYFVRLPAGPGPHPAVMFLHGYGGSGDGALRAPARLGPLIAGGWAVIAPDGARRGADGPRGWNAMAWPQGRDDVAFLGAVADDAARRFGLDRARIAASGFSAGGMMTWRLMCDAPDAYVAFAPVAGTLWKPIPARCAGPAPLLHVHGTADTVVPMAGRSLGGGRIVQGDLTEALAMLRASMGCAEPGRAGLPPAAPADWQGETWADCAGRGAITLLTHGGGHVAPRGWAEVALAFFAAHPGPAIPLAQGEARR